MILVQKLDMVRQYTSSNLFVKQIRSVLYPYSRLMYSNRRNKKELDYNCAHNNYILKILNDKRIDYFKRYKIPESHANKLHLHREQYGSYKSLEDILEIQDMTKEILDAFIHSIINDKQYKNLQSFRRSIIFPSADIPREQISTVLGIYVGTNIISWTLLESKENILEWKYENFLEVPKSDYTFELFNLAWKLMLKIPTADAYVMDETNFNCTLLKSVKQVKVFLQREKLKAMILAFLSQKNLLQGTSMTNDNEISSLTKNIYLLKYEKVVKLFNLHIGYEVMSSGRVINKLLYEEDCTNDEEKHPVGVYIQKDIMHSYNNEINYIKDQMNWSLLIALTFLQLGVLEKYGYEFV
ncbi:transcription elongation factor, mitochondrial-like isoform X2 [Vespula pensylvanica]|uniref:transcription elongation factor, mitochondrial-like isoform X2 n=1 Tax=Vespula pensylvanica TaxID=30213 RepID=UPI001CB9DA34|nr:transcription elongation factor, mitochondrial-like isoform X2 [Vespula pensylvanica]